MIINFPKNLIALAKSLPKPLYAVGGIVRNFIINSETCGDVDLCAPIVSGEFVQKVIEHGFSVLAEYKHTGAVLFTDGEYSYEYTCFRKETYHKGEHTPYTTEFVDDIREDALRRDFKCNAIYYDIANSKIVDPLGGVEDVFNRVLDTVLEPNITFSRDGLRLLRLARFAGELNFQPTRKVLDGASEFAFNILDIAPERIYAELKMILVADQKYSFSSKTGHYDALKILDKTRVLDLIFPDLTEGRGMVQRADFHKYDVLEHSLRCALYAHPSIRLGALLHDIGKPFCFKRDGYYYFHFKEGERLAEKALKKLKADKKTIDFVKYLVREHMADLDCSMKESKVRKFIVKHYENIEPLLMVKQADFRASLEVDYTAPTVEKWNKIIDKMRSDGTPFSLKQLKIDASRLIEIGYSGSQIGIELNKLFDFVVLNPEKNVEQTLLALAKKHFEKKK